MPPSARKDDYLALETIGKGNFGTCQRIMRKADKKVCMCQLSDVMEQNRDLASTFSNECSRLIVSHSIGYSMLFVILVCPSVHR
jgi:hypothetical protein